MKHLQLTLRELLCLTALIAVSVAWWQDHAAVAEARRRVEHEREQLASERDDLATAQASARSAEAQAEQAIQASEEYRRGYFYWREGLEKPKAEQDDGI